jgi:hypothetical protein
MAQYKCPECGKTGTKEQIDRHMYVEHKSKIGDKNPMWESLRVK